MSAPTSSSQDQAKMSSDFLFSVPISGSVSNSVCASSGRTLVEHKEADRHSEEEIHLGRSGFPVRLQKYAKKNLVYPWVESLKLQLDRTVGKSHSGRLGTSIEVRR